MGESIVAPGPPIEPEVLTLEPGAIIASHHRRKTPRVMGFVRWLGFALLAALALVGRPIVATERFSLWAEDGLVFMAQPRTLGIGRSIGRAYEGYLLLYPRIVGAVASALPIRWTPIIFLAGATGCASTCALVAWNSGRALGLSPVKASLLGAWILVLPAAGFEVVNTITNVQWFILPTTLVFGAAWIKGYRPPVILTCAMLAVAVLTTPLAAIVWPVLVVGAVVRRRRQDIAVVAVVAVAAAVQGWARFTQDAGSHNGTISAAQVAKLYTVRVVGGSFFGERLLHWYYTALSPTGAAIAALGLLVALALLSLRMDTPLRWISLGLLATSFVLLAGTMVFRSDIFNGIPNVGFVTGLPTAEGGRYMAGPAACVFLSALLCLQARPGRLPHPAVLVTADLCSAVVAVLLLLNFPIDIYRLPSAAWSTQVRQQQAECKSHGYKGTVSLVNSPGQPWIAVMTCRQAFG